MNIIKKRRKQQSKFQKKSREVDQVEVKNRNLSTKKRKATQETEARLHLPPADRKGQKGLDQKNKKLISLKETMIEVAKITTSRAIKMFKKKISEGRMAEETINVIIKDKFTQFNALDRNTSPELNKE